MPNMHSLLQQLSDLRARCLALGISMFWVLCRHLWHRSKGLNVVTGPRVKILGLENLSTSGRLQIAMNTVGFALPEDKTLLRIRGRLSFIDDFVIGSGCRFDIGDEAQASFHDGYITANTRFVIMKRLLVGRDCAIAWDCMFVDDDFHSLEYAGRVARGEGIELGDHVWVGCRAVLLKGTRIPDGCVVAAGSVVSRAFTQPNCLIAGNPARVVRQNINWS